MALNPTQTNEENSTKARVTHFRHKKFYSFVGYIIVGIWDSQIVSISEISRDLGKAGIYLSLSLSLSLSLVK